MASQPPDHDPIPELGRPRQPTRLLGLCVAPLPPSLPPAAPLASAKPVQVLLVVPSDCCLLALVVVLAADPDMLEVGRVAGSLEWNRAHFGYARASASAPLADGSTCIVLALTCILLAQTPAEASNMHCI